jgi:hypothetical protein
MVTAVRVEAPSTASALALVIDVAGFGTADLVPLDGNGRWEVRLVDPGAAAPLPELLSTLERWLAVWRLASTTVYIDDVAHTLPAATPRPA